MWQWVKEINKATGSDLYNGYCLETGTKDLLYTEDSLLCTTVSSIVDQELNIIVSSNYVKMLKEKETEKQLEKALKENAQLKKSHDQLKSKVLKLSNAVKKCKEAGYNPTRARTLHKLPFQCSEWH